MPEGHCRRCSWGITDLPSSGSHGRAMRRRRLGGRRARARAPHTPSTMLRLPRPLSSARRGERLLLRQRQMTSADRSDLDAAARAHRQRRERLQAGAGIGEGLKVDLRFTGRATGRRDRPGPRRHRRPDVDRAGKGDDREPDPGRFLHPAKRTWARSDAARRCSAASPAILAELSSTSAPAMRRLARRARAPWVGLGAGLAPSRSAPVSRRQAGPRPVGILLCRRMKALATGVTASTGASAGTRPTPAGCAPPGDAPSSLPNGGKLCARNMAREALPAANATAPGRRNLPALLASVAPAAMARPAAKTTYRANPHPAFGPTPLRPLADRHWRFGRARSVAPYAPTRRAGFFAAATP